MQRQNIRLILVLVLLACYHNSIPVRSYLRRAVLVSPDVSPWQKLYDEGGESLFLHMTGLTRRDVFNTLLHTVIPPIITFVVREGGDHGHCHQMGCWVFCCVIWEAKWQISGCV